MYQYINSFQINCFFFINIIKIHSLPSLTGVVGALQGNFGTGAPLMARCTASLSVTCNMSVVFSTNKYDRHDITEKLLKVVLNTITHSKIV
jgi:hypothetical protein